MKAKPLTVRAVLAQGVKSPVAARPDDSADDLSLITYRVQLDVWGPPGTGERLLVLGKDAELELAVTRCEAE